MERLDSELFTKVQNDALAFLRRRMHYDLRTQASDSDPLWRDSSQRMQNVMMKWRMVQLSLKPKTAHTILLRLRSSCKL